MKNALPLFGLFLLVACSADTAEHQEALDNLTSEWKKTTAALGELEAALQAERQEWKGMYAGMEAPEKVLAQLSEEQIEELADLKEACRGHGDAYSDMLDDVADHRADWEETRAELELLREELEAGKIKGNAEERIRDLEEEVREMNEEVKVRQEELKFTLAECVETCKNYADIVTSVNVQ